MNKRTSGRDGIPVFDRGLFTPKRQAAAGVASEKCGRAQIMGFSLAKKKKMGVLDEEVGESRLTQVLTTTPSTILNTNHFLCDEHQHPESRRYYHMALVWSKLMNHEAQWGQVACIKFVSLTSENHWWQLPTTLLFLS